MIKADNVFKQFGDPPQKVLHRISLEIKNGEFVSISGRSGSGKSTLLYILSTLDMPSEGSVEIEGFETRLSSSQQIHEFRNRYVGFIFQFHYLLPELTALENILLPARNLDMHLSKKSYAIELMSSLGILAQKNKFPSQMSGGEQQRVAIARALIMNPKYIFVDEPTGNLDTHNAEIVMSMLKTVNREKKTTIVLVTHEPEFSSMADREIFLVDGHVSRNT